MNDSDMGFKGKGIERPYQGGQIHIPIARIIPVTNAHRPRSNLNDLIIGSLIFIERSTVVQHFQVGCWLKNTASLI
jgi:hypothetical protein